MYADVYTNSSVCRSTCLKNLVLLLLWGRWSFVIGRIGEWGKGGDKIDFSKRVPIRAIITWRVVWRWMLIEGSPPFLLPDVSNAVCWSNILQTKFQLDNALPFPKRLCVRPFVTKLAVLPTATYFYTASGAKRKQKARKTREKGEIRDKNPCRSWLRNNPISHVT